jgi:DNA-binding NarL/FixJ family response regulator
VEILTIILVSAQPAVSSDVRAALEGQSDFLLREPSTDPGEILLLLEGGGSKIILIDIEIPDVDPIATILTIRRQYPSIKILGFSPNQNVAQIRALLRAGAAGYLLTSESLDSMVEVLHAAISGRSVFSPGIVTLLLHTPS